MLLLFQEYSSDTTCLASENFFSSINAAINPRYNPVSSLRFSNSLNEVLSMCLLTISNIGLNELLAAAVIAVS